MKFLVTLFIALVTFSTANAAKVDIYKDAIANKTFALRYKINEISVHNLNKDFNKNVIHKTDFFGHSQIKIDTSKKNKQKTNTEGIIVFNKVNNYKITDRAAKEAEKIEKYSNPYQQLFRDYNFGNTELYQALLPILPPNRIIATPNTPIYNFVGSGNLDGDLTYEDFYGEKNNFHSAIRYYFNGDKMIKIATFNYLKDENRVQFYEKYVIDITAFLNTEDEISSRIPSNLQDVTER